MSKKKVIGIDLGTTYCCVSIYENGTPEVIPSDSGNRTTPSMVGFSENEILVGDRAKYSLESDSVTIVFDSKRLIGRKFNDENIQSDMKFWPFQVIEKNGKPYFQVKHNGDITNYSPENISSFILSKLKETAEDYIGSEVTDAVITVPAYFSDAQRNTTIYAAKMAGLNVLRIINEPTAAAIAYGLDKGKKDELILVVDLGGGTFDVSLLSINNGTFRVLATAGDTHLGGQDFDNRMVDYFVKQIKDKHNVDISTNPRSLHRLKKACEEAKRFLSSNKCVPVVVNSIAKNINLDSKMTRSCFENLNLDLFQRIIEPLEIVIRDSNIDASKINEIILVGGSTRIPKVQEIVSSFFGGRKLKKSINPDEAVACGASIQASKLIGETSSLIENFKLLDVIPLSLGISIKGNIMSTIILRNSPIPITVTKDYYNSQDNQTVASIEVYEGERSMAYDNNLLDKFDLNGITPAPRGKTRVDVTFDVDENGILSVSAVETGTDHQKTIKVNNNNRLDQEEIDNMIEEFKKYKIEDQEEKERSEFLNRLEYYAYDLLKSLNDDDLYLKINNDDINRFKNKISSIIEWININYKASKSKYEEKLSELKAISEAINNLVK